MDTEKVKEHFRKHKWKYIIGGTIIVAGFTTLIMRNKYCIPNLLGGSDCLERGSMDTISFLNGSTFGENANITTNVYNQIKGHPGFITRCVDTGEIFETQRLAAKAFGIDDRVMSLHLNQNKILKEGLTFERIGILS